MGRRRVSRVLALLFLAVCASACSTTTVHDSARARDIDAEFADRIIRAARLMEGGFPDEAERLYLSARDMAQNFSPADPRRLRVHLELAKLYRRAGRDKEAEASYKALLADARAGLGAVNETAANALNELGVLYFEQRRLKESVAAFGAALTIRLQVHGEMHPATAATMQNLAAVHREVGNYEEAMHLYAGALRFYQQGDVSYLAAASVAQNSLALLYRATERRAQAEALHMEAIRLSSQANGPRNPNVAGLW